MQIVLYYISCENIVVNKQPYISNTIEPQTRLTLSNVRFLNETNTLSDIYIMIECISEIFDNIINYNYMYIPSLKRYYFINNIELTNNRLVSITAHVDVLMSFKNDLINLKAYVLRNENDFDDEQEDSKLPLNYPKIIEEKDLYVDASSDYVLFTPNNILKYNVVVNFLSNDTQLSIQTKSPSNNSLTTDVISSIGGQSPTTISSILHTNTDNSYDGLYTLMNNILKDDNMSTFINSIIVYPFNLNHEVENVSVFLGYNEAGSTTPRYGITVDTLKYNTSEYLTINKFTIKRYYNNFLDYEPYTQYELYLPYYGWINLSSYNVLNKEIIVNYITNYQDGSAIVQVINTTDKKLLFSSGCQLGIRIPLNTTNNTEITNQKNALTNNMMYSVFANLMGFSTSGINMLSTLSSMGIKAINTGVSIGGDIVAYESRMNQIYDRAQAQITGGVTGVYMPQQCRLRVTRPKTILTNDELIEYRRLFGKPLNRIVQLSTITGFTIIGDIHLENIQNAKNDEKNELYRLLQNGVIL